MTTDHGTHIPTPSTNRPDRHDLPVDHAVSRTDRDWYTHGAYRSHDDHADHRHDDHDSHWSGGRDRHDWDRHDWWRNDDRRGHRSHFSPSVFVVSPFYIGGYSSFDYCAPTLSSVSLCWEPSYRWRTSISFRTYDPFWYSDPLCISSSYYGRHHWYYYSPLSYSLQCPTYAYSYSSYLADTTPSTTIYNNYYTTYDTASPASLLDYAPTYQGSTDSYAASSGLLSGEYVNNGLTPNPAAAPGVAAPTVPADTGESITIFRATREKGQLAWSDTAASVVNTLLMSSNRGRDADRFLGRTVSGAWEVTLDSKRTYVGGTELVCRGTTTTGTGMRPTIVVQVPRDVTGIQMGQRLSVTGRLTEISVDDASNAGGYLVLENGDVSW